MSAEYLLKMEVLRRNREELTARRQEIERRIALREATAAEYSAIALQSCKQKWKSLRASAIAAKKRNDEFIREVHETQRKVDEAYVRTTQKLWPSDNQLELEKARYLRKVEELYPAWQEKMQAVRVQTLRELEEKKRAIEKRRYLAKKTFETEQTLDDLIQQTSHEIGLAENMEKNEAFEREVLRNQSVIQALRLDESIREHAAGARMYMRQQASEQLTTAQHVRSDVEEKIFETFSPRGAVKAMRQAQNAISFVESVDNNAEDTQQRPQRSQSITVPTTQYRIHATEDVLPDPYVNTHLDASDPASNARSWARSGLKPGLLIRESNESQTTRQSRSHVDSTTCGLSVHTHKAEELAAAVPPRTVSQLKGTTMQPAALSISTYRCDHVPEVEATGESFASITSSNRDVPELAAAFHALSAAAGIIREPESTTEHHQRHSPVTKPPSTQPTKPSDDRELAALKAGFQALAAATQDPAPDSVSHRLLMQQSPVEDNYGSKRSPDPKHDHARFLHQEPADPHKEGRWTPATVERKVARVPVPDPEEDQQFPAIGPFETYKFVEVERQEGPTKSIHASEHESQKLSPSKPDSASSEGTPTNDLALNLINSFESNQSSVMDFSVGKLLQTPVKATFGSSASEERQPSPPVVKTASGAAQSDENTIEKASVVPSSRTTSFDKKPSASFDPVTSKSEDHRTSSFEERQQHPAQALMSTPNVESSLVFSSLESASGIGSPTLKLGDDTMIESMSDFGSPVVAAKSSPAARTELSVVEKMSPQGDSPSLLYTDSHSPTPELPSLFTALSMPERLKALTALIARVEEGVAEGEQLSGAIDNEAPRDTKRELLRMAVSGRKAQINFFGSDVCFELVIDLARELGPVLFPAKAFEGILNDQKMKKVHQNGKEKEADMWKTFAAHMKQLHTAKAIAVSSLVDLFTSAFLSHDPSNLRSQRKLRELLFSTCGASETPSARPATTSTPVQEDESKESSQPRGGGVSMERETTSSPQIPTLLQTAFLQTTSTPKTKTYGIASSSFKKRSSNEDVLKSMASSPGKFSQKLMRGGKMGDYSEFEEEDEVDLDNLIGSKPSMASSSHNVSSNVSKTGAKGQTGQSSSRFGGGRDDKDDFDVDF